LLLQKGSLRRRSWTTQEGLRAVTTGQLEQNNPLRRRWIAQGRLIRVAFATIMSTPSAQVAWLQTPPLRAADSHVMKGEHDP